SEIRRLQRSTLFPYTTLFRSQAGLMTALGIGSGIFLHVAYSLLGIGLIVSQSIWLFNLLKLLAAAYLLYIGIKALGARPQANAGDLSASQVSMNPGKAF